MAGKKRVALSGIYSAPQFCREFIDLAQRSLRCRGLHIRRRVEINVMQRGKPKTKTVWTEC